MGYFNTEKKKWRKPVYKWGWASFCWGCKQPKYCNSFFFFLHEKSSLGVSFWSSGSDSVLPVQGTQIQPLRRELDPVCCKEDAGATAKT